MRRLLLVAIVIVGAPSAAAALTLRYSAPEGCPPADVVRAAVAEGLGGPLDAGEETVEVSITADRRTARLALTDGEGQPLGERAVRAKAADCDALVRAAGLSAGLALAPLRQVRRSAAPLEAPGVEAPGVEATVVERAAPTASSRWWGQGSAGLALGLHPGVALTLDGGAALAWGPWSVRGGVWLAAAPAWLDGDAGGGRVRGGSAALAVAGCGERAAWTGCVGLRGGLQLHDGLDFATGDESLGPWVAALAAVEWRVFDGVWGPRIEVMAPLGRLTLTVDEVPVWTTPAIAGGLGLAGRW